MKHLPLGLLLLLATCASTPAQDLFGSLDPGAWGKHVISTKMAYSSVAERTVKTQKLDLGWTGTSFSITGSPWKTDDDKLTVSASYDILSFDTDAVLPDTGAPFPGRLWKLSFRGSVQHKFENGWVANASLGVVSSSDEPFHSFSEMGFHLSLFLRIPFKKKSAWIITLFYGAGGGELSAIPFGALGFFWHLSKEFQALIGLPFLMINARPLPWLMLNAVYFPITNIHAHGMIFTKFLPFLVKLAFDWKNRGYYLHDREKRSDQLLLYEKKIDLAFIFFLGRKINLTLTAGYAFDREFLQGGLWSGTRDRMPMENGPFFAVEGAVKF